MADLKLNVTAPGLSTLVDQSAVVNENLKQAALNSQRISTPVKSAAAPSGMGETKTARSLGQDAGTGSSASDFAAQAQGLGGLVHVYATFAANLYAISAAFGALSKAMDTANLIRGLDQLGATSGRSLGSLAKQIVAVTDGAISMRDAMTSTALASSGGMTNAAIIRMTEVAKRASLALGRDLPDSMERLTKGIVKIQPELLDELGIMTRVIPAQEEYARSIGKTISTLTDFEKRQAFTNAVLAEGEKKFGNINLDTNPYSKVLASINNLMQSGLELVNKVLGPIISALSANPTGLAIVLGGIATVLLKQAIPALGMYRAAAKQAQEESYGRLQKLASDNNERLALGDARAAESAEKQFQAEAVKDKRIEALTKTRTNRQIVGASIQDITRKSAFEQTPADVAALQQRSDTLLASEKATHQKQGLQLQEYLSKTNKLRAESEAAGTAAANAREAADEHRFSHASLMNSNLAIAEKEATKRRILAITTETAAIAGSREAYALLNLEIAKQKAAGLGFVPAGMLKAAGVFAIITEAAKTLSNVIMDIVMYVGIAVAVFEVLDTIFTKNAKQAGDYGTALTALTDSFDNTRRTIDRISEKDPLSYFSVESTQAKATALNELTGNLDNVINKFKKVQEAQGPWDKFWDDIWSVFGKGSRDKLISGISGSVVDSFKLLEEGPAKSKAKDSLEKLLGQKVDVSSMEAFNASIANLGKAVISSKASDISKILNEANRAAGSAAESLTAFSAALGNINKQSLALSNALVPTDDFSKLGLEMQTGATKLGEALKDPINSLTALRELAKDTRALSLLPPGTGTELALASKKLDEIATSQAVADKAALEATNNQYKAEKVLADAKEAVQQLSATLEGGAFDQTQANLYVESATKALDASKEQTAQAKSRLEIVKSIAAAEVAKFKDVADTMTKISFDLLGKGLSKALSEAAIVSAKSYLDLIKSSGGPTAALEAQISRQEIDIQIKDINVRYDNTKAILDLSLKVRELSLIEEKSILRSDMKEMPGNEEAANRYKKISSELASVQFARETLTGKTPETLRKMGTVGLDEKGNKLTEDQIKGMSLLKEAINLSFGRSSALAGLYAKLGVVGLTERVGVKAEEKGAEIKGLERTGTTLATSASDLANVQAIVGGYNSILEARRTGLELAILDNKEQITLANLEKQSIGANEVINELGKKNKLTEQETNMFAAANTALATIAQDKESLINKTIGERSVITDKYLQTRKAGEASLNKAEEDHQKTMRAYSLELKTIQDTDAEARLTYLKDMGVVSEADYIRQSNALKLSAEDRKYQEEKSNYLKDQSNANDKLKQDTDDLKAKQAGYLKIIQETEDSTNSTEIIAATNKANTDIIEALKAIGVLQKRNTEESGAHLAVLDAGNTSRKLAITLTEAQKILQADQTKQMTDMAAVTSTLASLFGDLGTNIGKASEAILTMAQTDTKYLSDKNALLKQQSDAPMYSEEQKNATKALMKLDEEKAKKDDTNSIMLLNSTKKLFSEKTAMYKVLDNAEKISSALKLANQLKEMGFDLRDFATKIGLLNAEVAATGVAEGAIVAEKVAAAPAKVASEVPGILAAYSTLGPVGTAIGVALVAALLAKVGGGGGGTQVDMTGLTSADRQKTQGTGQAYVGGTLQDTGGGVFGDSGAKSKTIVDALVTMKENSIEGLDYDNQMLKALNKLADSVTGAAKSLYAIPGLRAGKGFGTEAGSTSSPGAFGDIPIVGKLLGSIFGGGTSSSASITSAGVALTGSFKTVMDDVAGSITQYKDVLTQFHSDGGWLGNDSDWSSLQRQTQELKQDQRTALSDIFKDADALFIALGKKVGVTKQQIDKVLSNFDITMPVDLMNLTGQALIDELNAVVGTKISDAAKLIFGGFDKFKKFGEDYLGTVLRVVDSNNKADQSLRSIGHSFNLINKFDISETMIAAAGSLDTFMTQASFFKDNFLTNAEKLAPVQKSVNEQLTKLGINTNISKEQYKKLVLAQDLSTVSGQEMYQSLMGLAPGFNTMINALDSANQAIADQEIKIYDLLGKSSDSLALSRQKELNAMDASLRPRQKYINALTDEIAIRNKLESAYTTTNNSLTASIKTLNDYKIALKAGASSTLTPTEKYAQAKAIFMQTAAAAQAAITTSSTAADIAARDAALGRIQATGDTLLTASKEVNASGAAYAADFASVTDTVGAAADALAGQKTDLQKQLGFLETTAESTKTMATLLDDYLKAQKTTALAQADAVTAGSVAAAVAIPGHARGGLAKGISLVGEQGPEIVDFANPGRVYSNQASNDLFNTKELVAEIKALREEVCQLRDDQNKQTGALIDTTLKANAQNAEAITTATANAVNQQNWKTRSQVKLA